MKKSFAIIVCLAAVCQGADSGTAAAVEGGTASFVVNTTVPGISVKGKSTALEAHAVVQRVPDGLHLEKVEASHCGHIHPHRDGDSRRAHAALHLHHRRWEDAGPEV